MLTRLLATAAFALVSVILSAVGPKILGAVPA